MKQKENDTMRAKNYVMTLVALSMIITGQFAFANGGQTPPPPAIAADPLVVGNDGTAYVISHQAAGQTAATKSTLNVITEAGAKTSGAIDGNIVHLAIGKDNSSNETLIIVDEIPVANNGAHSPNQGGDNATTAVYLVSLPLTQSSTLITVSLNGVHASKPVVVNGFVYITTESGANNGGNAGDLYPTYQASGGGTSYLYVVSLNGAIISKTAY